MIKYYPYKLNIIIFALLPMALVLSRFVADFFVSLIALIYLFYTIKFKYFVFYKNIYFKLSLLFCIYIFLTSIFSDYILNSLRVTIPYFRYILFACATLFMLKNSDKFLNSFFYALLITIIIVLLFGFYQFIFGVNILYSDLPLFHFSKTSELYSDFRISGLFHDELVQGGYLLRLMPILIGIFFLSKNHKIQKNIFIFFILLILLMILFSGERAAIALSSVFLFILFLFNDSNIKKKISQILIFFLFFGTIIFNHDGIKNRVINNTKALLFEKSEIQLFSSGHEQHYKTSFEIFKKNKLLGVGVRNFRYECRDPIYKYIGPSRCTTHPHNIFFQFLVETGIIGLAFLFIAYFYIGFFFLKQLKLKFLNKKKINMALICFGSAILINIFPLVPSGNFFNNWLSILYFFPIGFFIYTLKKEND